MSYTLDDTIDFNIIIYSMNIIYCRTIYIIALQLAVFFTIPLRSVQEMGITSRDVHWNGKYGIPIPLVGFPWEWEPNCVN